MRRLAALLFTVAAAGGGIVLGGALGAGGCGSGSVCGNGKLESGEQCDHGAKNGTAGNNCSADCQSISVLIPQLQVTWDILATTGVADYSGVACETPGAPQVRIVLQGPTPTSQLVDCNMGSKTYLAVCPSGFTGDESTCPRLQAGKYSATVTLIGNDGSALTRPVTTSTQDVQAGPLVNFDVHFAMADFLKQDYKGTLDFQAFWGMDGVSCMKAQPTVTAESVTLVPDGKTQPVMAMTVAGNRLDGTPGKCFVGDNVTTYESVPNLPWGKYTLTISDGKAGNYAGSRDVFVQMGSLSPTFKLVVPPVDHTDMAMSPADMATPADQSSPTDAGALPPG